MVPHFRSIVAGFGLAALVACSDRSDPRAPGATPAPPTYKAHSQAMLPFEMPGAQSHLPPVVATTIRARRVQNVRFTDVRGHPSSEAIEQLGRLSVFESTSGPFRPADPITRSEYVRWLVRASNAFFATDGRKQIALSAARDSSFADLPASHPDFAYVQGMADAGFVIGIDGSHFAPDRLLDREELLALLITRDKNRLESSAGTARPPVEIVRDGAKVSPRYWQLLHDDQFDMAIATHDNLHRTFGSGEVFYPMRRVTRAQAALSLQWIDGIYAGDVLKR